MNSMMTVTIRVRGTAAAAGELQMLERQVGLLNKQMAASAVAGSRFRRVFQAGYLDRFGKNLQWTGRQIEYNFTLPILLAAGAATKFAMDNERAMVRLRKVYGTFADTTRNIEKEISDLGLAFRALSDLFGVAQDEVIQIGASWAQAGASGIAVAKATRSTLELMILGEMEAADATTALIQTQAQWGANTKELTQIIATLNMVENETAANLQDLIEVQERAAGSARSAGVDYRYLAAYTAALVPAAGEAARVGSGLRTMFSRIMAPTTQTLELFQELGLTLDKNAWYSSNFNERMMQLAQAMDGLTQSQQNVVASTVASRWQVSRFDVLVRDILNPMGRFNRALEVTADNQRNLLQVQREVGEVLASSPQAFQILWTQMKNLLAEIIIPLIPAILAVGTRIVEMVRAFTRLSPVTQQWVFIILAAVAAVGTFTRVLGASILLVNTFVRTIAGIGNMFFFVGREMFAFAGLVKNGFLGLYRVITTGFLAPVYTMFRAAFVGMATFALKTFGLLMTNLAGYLNAFALGVWNTMVLPVVRGFSFMAAQALASFLRVGAAATSTMLVPVARATAVTAYTGAQVFIKGFFLPVIAGFAATARAAVATFAMPILRMVATLAAAALAKISAFLLATVGKFLVAKAAIIAPWLLIAGAIAGALFLARDHISAAINWIADNWRRLPEVIWNVMKNVVNIVRSAARAIMQMFTDMFSFGFSVPTVTTDERQATAAVRRQAGGGVPGTGRGDKVSALLEPGEFVVQRDAVAKYGAPMLEAINAMKFQSGGLVPGELAAFLSATSGARAGFRAREVAEKREIVLSFAPGAGAEFDDLVAAIARFQQRADQLTASIRAQESVVASWEVKLNRADQAVDAAQARLAVLRDRLSQVADALNAAQAEMDRLANVPITGMQRYSDALFENEMAQKRLRLEILKLEEAGQSVDDLRDKMARLSGEIEMLRGEREDLRLAGAGSDVLATYDQQISQLEAQRQAIMDTESPIGDLQRQLEELQRAAEILQLEEAIEYDPLRRQIEQLVNAQKEMNFEDIIAGIKAQQGEVARLTAEYDQVNAAVLEQERVLAHLQSVRDEINLRYQEERDQLAALRDEYSLVTGQIRDMEAALSEFVAEAKAAQSAADGAAGGGVSENVERFREAGAGDFEIPGGTAGLGFEEGDIAALAAQWAEEAKTTFGSFDIFAPIREKWNALKAWFTGDQGRLHGYDVLLGDIVDNPDIWDRIGGMFSFSLEGMKEGWNSILDWLRENPWTGPIMDAGFDLNIRGLTEPFQELVDFVLGMWDSIVQRWGPELEAWKNMFTRTTGGIQEAWKNFWAVIEEISIIIMGVFKVIWPVLLHTAKPILDAVVGVFRSAFQFIRGIVEFFIALFTGQWGDMGQAILTILDSMWDVIYEVFRGAIGVVIGIIRGFVEGFIDAVKWLWREIVGNSIIPDMVNDIIDWIVTLKDKVIQFVKDMVNKVVDWFKNLGQRAVRAVTDLKRDIERYWAAIKSWLRGTAQAIRDTVAGYFTGLRDRVVNTATNLRDRVVGLIVNVRDRLAGIWTAIRDKASSAMGTARDWVVSRVQSLKDKVVGIATSLRDTVSGVWNAIRDRGKEAFRGLVDGIRSIISGIKGAVRAPIAWVADNVINRFIGGVNAIASRVGLGQISKITIPAFHEGGVVGEDGRARNLARHPIRQGETLALLRDGERVLTETERAWYEQNNPDAIRHVGGPIDWVRDVASDVAGAVRRLIGETVRPAVNAAMSLLDRVPGGGTGFGQVVIGTARNMGNAVIDWLAGIESGLPQWDDIVAVGREMQRMGYHVAEHPAFGGVAPVHSPNSYHYRGAAIDVNYYPASREKSKLDQLHGWIRQNVSGIAELIWQAPGHWSHLHLAMRNQREGSYGPGPGGSSRVGGGGVQAFARGGVLTRPTLGLLAERASSRPEIVTPERLMRRIVREEAGGGGDTHLHFHGDLEFPNVKNGEDAEAFVRNIEAMAG